MRSSVEKKVTPLQYALDLFVEKGPARTPIDTLRSDKDIGYQKNSLFARIIGLGLSARRFVDAAYFIVAQEPEVREAYEVSLSFFKWLMRYDSHNKQHFSSVIRSVKSSMLEVTSAPVVDVDSKGRLVDDSTHDGHGGEGDVGVGEDDEGPEHATVSLHDDEGDWLELIGRVSVRNGRIRFRVPIELQRLIKDPENSYWTSLLVTSKFTLIYGRGIYDYVLPMVPDGLSSWTPLDVVRNLPGKSWANNAEFKYFKRDYLDPAIKQINELSDIEISYETRAGTPGSRKKDQIRFRLKRKEEAAAAKADMLLSATLFLTLDKDFGLSDKQFEQIAQNRRVWSDDRIQAAIDYTWWRIRSGDHIRRVSSYLMTAIEKGLRIAEAAKHVELVQARLAEAATEDKDAQSAARNAVSASLAAADAAAEQRRLEDARKAREFFTSAEQKTREDLVRKFFASSALGLRAIERQGLKPVDVTEANILQWPSIAVPFSSFVAGELRKAARASRSKQSAAA
jgi:Initiator Replication protein